MPKNNNIKSVLIIGSGPIVIGQACEFDYSGTQAIKALKSEGIRVILLNSNPATIMTDPNLADATYIEPITWKNLEKIIKKERPQGILATVGGQTALNCALEAHKNGVLDKYKVELLGVSVEGIKKAEDRALFSQLLEKLNLGFPKSTVVSSYEQALKFTEENGFPCILRPSFTMGGQGGGIAKDKDELSQIIKNAIKSSPVGEVQIDESLIGWKEYELELVCDQVGNCIVICSIENLDPMGIHTGDSITIAPALTLTDKEFQIMRNASFDILREVGLKTGGANVQFAINPKNGDMIVIEVNPRVSRSSALASKATGFPIAKVAALLSVGYTLDELQNDCTKTTPFSFEPTIDYVVCKIPKFNFDKFPKSSGLLHTSMQAVGEVMAVGNNFLESFQKAYSSLDKKLNDLQETTHLSNDEILAQLPKTHYKRIPLVIQALRQGISIDKINEITHIDKWFLHEFKKMVDLEQEIKKLGANILANKQALFHYKLNGFADTRIEQLANLAQHDVTQARIKFQIKPAFKQIDTCAGEFLAHNNYYYSCYQNSYTDINGNEIMDSDSKPTDKKKVIVIGAGANRIGQGLEFDYVCVQSLWALQSVGIEAIMINSNPETVSTDYDVADRLYFEPLCIEHILEVINLEKSKGELLGVIVQFGGQTPINLAKDLENHGVKILGTSIDNILQCEERKYFSNLMNSLDINQSQNSIAHSKDQAKSEAIKLGFPLVIRPSYVIGGQNMSVVYNIDQLNKYLDDVNFADFEGSLLLDKYLNDAIEVDVDAIGDGENIHVAGILEQFEEAGIHSGDSACSFPPFSLDNYIIDSLKEHTIKIGKALAIKGLMNIQFAIQNNKIFVLEVNPRASRTIPFIAKASGYSLAFYATLTLLDKKLSEFSLPMEFPKYYSIKDVVLPFDRFPNNDFLLGPQMKSTGEVMGIDHDFSKALIKAYASSMQILPTTGTILLSINHLEDSLASILNGLSIIGFKIACFSDEVVHFDKNNVTIDTIIHAKELHEDNIKNILQDYNIVSIISVINNYYLEHITLNKLEQLFNLRRKATFYGIPYFTSILAMKTLAEAIYCNKTQETNVLPIQEYYKA